MTIVIHRNMTPEQVSEELNSLYSKSHHQKFQELASLKTKRKKIRTQISWAFDLKGLTPLELQKEWRHE